MLVPANKTGIELEVARNFSTIIFVLEEKNENYERVNNKRKMIVLQCVMGGKTNNIKKRQYFCAAVWF